MPVLFKYPRQARFGQPVPKSKIYEYAKPTKILRECFVDQIDKIIWQYKLAPETINLPAKPAVPEIQIFDILLKTDELNEAVLHCIDKAIPFPIIYRLQFQDQVKITAAYKRPSEAENGQWVISDYFSDDWLPSDSLTAELPVALDLSGLYRQLLQPLLTWPQQSGESLQAQVERISKIRKTDNERRKLEARLQKEKQFNRKVELNAQLRQLKQQLVALTTH